MTQKSFASDTCKSIFNTSATLVNTGEQLFESVNEKLKKIKSPFRIKNGVLYADTLKNSTIRIADLSIVNPEYLFEYQDQSYHDEWKKNGGITKAEMNGILAQQGQAFGRGFYVSMSPTDSRSYGDFINVFQVSKPFIVIDSYASNELLKSIINNEDYINTFRSVGISGVRSPAKRGNDLSVDRSTWLNIFDETLLRKMVEFDSYVYEYSISLLFDSDKRKALGITNSSGVFQPLLLTTVKNINYEKLGLSLYLKNKTLDIDKILSLPISQYSDFEYAVLTNYFVENPMLFFVKLADATNQQESLQKLKELFSRLSLADIDLPQSLNLIDIDENSILKLRKFVSQIPFFDFLFSLQDISEIKNLKKMSSIDRSLWLERFTSQNKQLKNKKMSFKSVEDLQAEMKIILNKTIEIRSDATNYKFASGRTDNITVNGILKSLLAENLLLNIQDKGIITTLPGFSKVSLRHLDISDWQKFDRLLSEGERKHLKNLYQQSVRSQKLKKEATEKLILLISRKFFDPKYFNLLNEAFGTKAEVDAIELCSIFLSLAPFKTDNHLAARLYYQYLVSHYFDPQISTGKYLKLKNEDSFLIERYGNHTPSEFEFLWYISRLWVVSSSSLNEAIHRAEQLDQHSEYGATRRNLFPVYSR